ncbi:MAG: nickel pincer cofactor biosynthesis protein LarB [Verrucomicrobiales bacterium]|nr:nickel pincer cofactor biosynthesis protein LarB [Verrucomicrobiales bacterium]MCP5560038.1 nickel pincer cofactor biosynthesis protein LarB [Verrucomicrobiaceae bacterium]
MMAGVNADVQRLARQGLPEVVYAAGKTVAQVQAAVSALHAANGCVLATRVSPAVAAVLSTEGAVYDEISQVWSRGALPQMAEVAPVAVICAGTSDLPVAEEAARVLEFGGVEVLRVVDVGVAGLHRLLKRVEEIQRCSVVIVVAGMDGALPSVVGGLVRQPVIAVPTSVGYGASLQGIAALLTMLNSCAAGLAVVNIDNGFGAAVHALRILLGQGILK